MGTKKNTDTVPAMLTPGEFVIKRDSAKKIGYDALELMNETGKVPDMKKHGGKMAGYLKSKFLNGMMQGYQEGGEVGGLSQLALNQLTPVGFQGLSVPRPSMMSEEEIESFDDEDLLGQILTYGAPMQNVMQPDRSMQREITHNLAEGAPYLQQQIMEEHKSQFPKGLFGQNEYDWDDGQYHFVGPGKGQYSAQDAAEETFWDSPQGEMQEEYYEGYQDGGAVPFQISPNATLSRRPTQIDVEPSTGGMPINVMDIMERTGPGATTPGPFTGSSEKTMIDGLINYIMSPDYDSRTGKHKKPKQKMEEISTFGSKSATADSALKAGQNVKQQAIAGSRMQQKMFENELMGIGAAAVKANK